MDEAKELAPRHGQPAPSQGELGPAGPPVGHRRTGWESARRDTAGVASSLIPGAGHFLLGAPVRGTIWLLLALAASYLWWGLRLPSTFGGLVLAVIANFAIWILAGADALFGMRRKLPRAHPLWLVVTIIIGLLAAELVSNFECHAAGFHALAVKSADMATTILPGEAVMVDTHAWRTQSPQPGNLIAFDRLGHTFVLRVIAAGGATVQGQTRGIRLNGALIPEPYARYSGPGVANIDMPNLDNFPAVTVPQGEFFVAGDNRNQALDSRSPDFGLVTDQAVIGQPLYIVKARVIWRLGRTLR